MAIQQRLTKEEKLIADLTGKLARLRENHEADVKAAFVEGFGTGVDYPVKPEEVEVDWKTSNAKKKLDDEA